VPAINLDIRDFRDTDRSLGDWEKMKDFTNNLLMLHNAPRLEAIRLGLYIISFRSYPGPGPGPVVDRWVRRVIKHHPLVLDIFVCRSFTHIFQIPLIGSAFCRLKTLKLQGVSLDNCFTDRLNSGCPVLEDLVLNYCRNEFDAIQSDTLKNLVVETCSSRIADVLVIRAPCLTSLSLNFPYICYRNGLSLEAGNSLVMASISVESDGSSQSYQTMILGNLWNVTSLDLKGFGAMAFLDKELDKFPIFDNLRTLSLSRCFLSEHDVHTFKALGRFLQKSPNLEKLSLQDFWVRPVVGPIEFPMLNNLRTLFLDECDLRDNFRILRHLLRRSPNLEKLSVRCCKLPEGSVGGKGKARKTHLWSRNLVRFQCHKLKSTEIIYEKGDKIQELVCLLLDISECAPMDTVTLTKV